TETHARDAGVEVARRAAGSGAELLIAFGGDGLVNEVVNGMAGSDATLAIIPGGTMNVFARNLGLPTNPTQAADHILRIAGDTEEVVLAVGLVGDAYAYLAGRPLRLSPNGPPDGGLGLFMVRRLSFVNLPRYAFGALTGRFGPGAVSLADLDEFIVSGDEAVAYHVDGETLEPASKVHVRPAPRTLSVLV